MSVQDLIVSLDRVLPAPPEGVFAALTEPDLFAQWMGPEGSDVTVEEMTVTMGGRLAFLVALPDGGPQFHLFGFDPFGAGRVRYEPRSPRTPRLRSATGSVR